MVAHSSGDFEWATTKQAYRDELVVYLFFSPIYTSLYFYVLSTVLRTSSFTLYVCIICMCIKCLYCLTSCFELTYYLSGEHLWASWTGPFLCIVSLAVARWCSHSQPILCFRPLHCQEIKGVWTKRCQCWERGKLLSKVGGAVFLLNVFKLWMFWRKIR